VFHDYRGVQLGMTADEVRKNWAIPKTKVTNRTFSSLTKAKPLSCLRQDAQGHHDFGGLHDCRRERADRKTSFRV